MKRAVKHVCSAILHAAAAGRGWAMHADMSEDDPPQMEKPKTRIGLLCVASHGGRVGLRILAFPCNQFAHQEPGNAEEIQCFIRDNKVKFDLFEKVDVNGGNAHPLWKFLKNKQGGTLIDAIKWNFTKFIVDKNGVPVERHGPNTSPNEMKKELLKYLDAEAKQEL